jgi:hypothetical protein
MMLLVLAPLVVIAAHPALDPACRRAPALLDDTARARCGAPSRDDANVSEIDDGRVLVEKCWPLPLGRASLAFVTVTADAGTTLEGDVVLTFDGEHLASATPQLHRSDAVVDEPGRVVFAVELSATDTPWNYQLNVVFTVKAGDRRMPHDVTYSTMSSVATDDHRIASSLDGDSSTALDVGSIVLALAFLGSIVWMFVDARRLRMPAAWLALGAVAMWIVVFPLYLWARRRAIAEERAMDPEARLYRL